MVRRISLVSLAVAVAVLIGGGAAHAGVSKVDGGIEFTYSDSNAGSVHLAGDFNDWNMNATPLTMDDDGTWSVVVDLGPGEYEYKFVINGSEWIADPDNPTIVGEYGNSGLSLDDDGEPVKVAVATPVTNTGVNSRVRINGWYRAVYEGEADLPSDNRPRLTRPDHELYVSVNPTVSSNVSGSATVRMSTGSGDIKEVHADIYSGRMDLESDDFDITGFYNEEVVQFDNPTELLGHMDLLGTIPEEHIPFGRGAQGLIASGSYKKLDGQLVYANIYDYDIMNDPSELENYDNTDTDLLAARLKAPPAGPVHVGATYASWRDGWWIDWTGSNYSPHLQDYIDGSGSSSDWFELSRSDRWIGVDASVYDVAEMFDVRAEYAVYHYECLWDMGNKEKVEGEDYSNGEIDVPVGDTDGWLVTGIAEGSPLQPLNLRLQLDFGGTDGMGRDEEYVAFGTPLWAGGVLPLEMLSMYSKRQYTEVRFDGSPLVANVYDPLPKTEFWGWELDAGLAIGIFDLDLELDHHRYEIGPSDSMEAGLGFADWDGRRTRVAGSAHADIRDDLWFEFAGENLTYTESSADTPYSESGLFERFGILDTSEWILRGGYSFTDNWSVIADLRTITYRDVETAATDTTGAIIDYFYPDETFFAPYLAVVYSPRKNVQVQLGYGVDPLNYVDTPIEGRGNGRERWRERYLWNHSDHDAVDAEQALADARTFGLMAVIAF